MVLHTILEVSNHNHAIGNLYGTGISIRLGLNFYQAIINSVMTHVLGFKC